MPTYADLETEAVYLREYEPDALAWFNGACQQHYGHSRAQTGSRGDNRHLYGRHRSRSWCTNSRYCTDRSYGTRDARDTAGPADALRASDVGIQGQQLRDASRRLDAAVRGGELPELAEWFGTKDGVTVVGWYEGHASSSDDNHLWHLHLGYWTNATDDREFFGRLFAVITGTEEDDMGAWDQDITLQTAKGPVPYNAGAALAEARQNALALNGTHFPVFRAEVKAEFVALRSIIQTLADALRAGGGSVDTAAILAGVDERLAALRQQVRADVDAELDEAFTGGADRDS